MATQRPQQASIATWVVLGSIGAGIAATAYLYPGVGAIWAGLLLAAWLEPPALFTGPKVNGRPTPLDDRETKNQQRYAFWSSLKTGLLSPAGWLPGKPVLGSWIAATAAAAPAALLPVAEPAYRGANALFAFVIVAQVAASRRAATGSPGTRVDSIRDTLTQRRAAIITATITGCLGGAVAGFIVGRVWFLAPPEFLQARVWMWILAGAANGALIGPGMVMRRVALAHWREIESARSSWAPRWEAMKVTPPPTLTDVKIVGAAEVAYFETRGSASEYLDGRRAAQITAEAGGGVRVAALTCPNVSNGQPVAGSVHPNRFLIATWPSDQFPNPSDPDLDDETRLLAVRAEYQTRWSNLKVSPVPEVLESELVGAARVDTFLAGYAGAGMYWTYAPKLAPTFPNVNVLAVLPTADGPDMRSQQQFTVVTWASGLPDITDPDITDQEANLAFSTAIARACESSGFGVPMLESADRIRPVEEGAPQAWEVRLLFPDGPSMEVLRTSSIGSVLADMLGCDCVIDHRNGGVIWIGALTRESVPARTYKRIEEEAEEDRFRPVWTQALKMYMRAPQPQPNLKQTRSLLPDEPGGRSARNATAGPTITRYAFGISQGINPADYFGFEERIGTALFPTSFLATTGCTDRRSIPGWDDGRPGDRHPRLLVLYHSSDPNVPASPDQLAPSRAAEWVLAGMVNKAFKAARLTQPEVILGKPRCLTMPNSTKHIWRVPVRLYGGNTLTDVRAVRSRLAGGFGAPWLRVTTGDDEGSVTIYVGADPTTLTRPGDDDNGRERPTFTLARPEDRLTIESLNWEQAFIDAKIAGSEGRLPTLVKAGTLEKNPQVSVLDFSLPPGIDLPSLRKAKPTIVTNTGNEFVDIRPGSGGASTVTILCSVTDPMPERASYDYPVALGSSAIPFATGVDGEPVVYDWKTSPHLLIAGMTGAGKSACLQQLIEGVVLRGAELYILDPTKGAADFRFAESFASGIAVDLSESAAMMKGLYAEVTRRKNVNAQHGVGSYRDLPADVRPPHLVIVIDEFTSLMGTEPVSKTPFDDPDAEAERAQIIAGNTHRMQIGSFTGKIAREARSAGVSLFLATQKLSMDMLSKIPGAMDLKVNLARILLGNTTYGDRQSALRMPDNAPDLGTTIPIGRGIFEPSISGPVAMQVWYDQPEKLGAFLTEHAEPVTRKFDLTPYLTKQPNSGPAVSDVSLDDLFATNEPDIVDLGDLELDLDDLEEPLEPDDEAEPVAVGPEAGVQDAVADSGTLWDRPWGSAPTTDRSPAETEPGLVSGDARSHRRAPVFGVSEF